MRILVVGLAAAALMCALTDAHAQVEMSRDALDDCARVYQSAAHEARQIWLEGTYANGRKARYGTLADSLEDAQAFLNQRSTGAQVRLCQAPRLAQLKVLASRLKVKREEQEAEAERKRVVEIEATLDKAIATPEE